MMRRTSIIATLMAVMPSLALAAGFTAHEQSSSAMGSAFAGDAAWSADASGQWYNPALMEALPETVVSLNSQLSFLETRFSDHSGSGGDDRESVDRTQNSFYFADPVTERLSLGLAVNRPLGTERRYDDPWAGDSYALETRVESLNVNPSLSWRVSSRLTLGLGFSYQKLDLELRNSVYDLDMDDTGMGWNAGLLFEPSPGHRLGLAWRSKVNYRLRGSLRSAGGGQSFDVVSAFDTPGTVTGSYAGDLTAQTRLLLSVSMTEWQEVDSLIIEDTASGNSLTEQLSWSNSVMSSVGVSHATSNGTVLRAGYAHETGSQGKAEERAPLAPEARRNWLALGATFHPAVNFSIDVAVARVLFDDAPVERSEERDGNVGDETLDGNFDMNRSIVGAQLNYRF